MAIRIETLGGLRVARDGEELLELPHQRLRCGLVVFMAIERRTSRECLAGLLWPRLAIKPARKRLSTMLYELRRGLGTDWIEAHGEELVATDALTTDAQDFVARADGGVTAEAAAMYRGPFLGSSRLVGTVEFERWADAERSRLAALNGDVQGANLDDLLARGEVKSAIFAARRWVLADPLDDDAQHRLIDLLGRSGLRNEALRQFEDYRQRLSGIDAEPLPSIVALVQKVRSGTLAVEVPKGIGVGVEHRINAKTGVVVFPILNLSRDASQQYFCDGLAEEIIHALGRAPGLRVVPRTSAFTFDKPGVRVGLAVRELGVTHALESSVRFDGHRYRVRIALIDGSDETKVWQDRFEGVLATTDVFKLQDEVAEAVLGALADRLRLTPEIPAQASHSRGGKRNRNGETADPVAYSLYLRGRHAWFGRRIEDLKVAEELFREATTRDDDYARAHAGMADVYLVLAGMDYATDAPSVLYGQAREATDKALERGPDLAQAHAARGNYLMNYKWDWDAAGKELQQAIKLDPGYSSGRQWFSNYLMSLGREDEAIAEATLALELDPRSVFLASSLARHYQLMRQPDRAKEQYREALKIDPTFVSARIGLALAEIQSDNARECIEQLETLSSKMDRDVPLVLALLAYAHGCAGEYARARKGVQKLKGTTANYLPPEYVALAYIGLGDHDRALHWLEKALDAGSPTMTLLKMEPIFDPLRSSPRFRRLLSLVGLDSD